MKKQSLGGLSMVFGLMTACGPKNTADILYYGKDSQSAKITFTTDVEVTSKNAIENAKDFISGARLANTNRIINKQVEHTFGAFTQQPDFIKTPGTIRNNGSFKINGASLLNPKTAAVNYTYTDEVAFKKSIFTSRSVEIEFYLPKNPETIYKKGMLPNARKNPCTDDEYNEEENFWYFWNPFKENCPISIDDDLIKVKAALEGIPETHNTFPYYKEIFGNGGNGKTVDIYFLAGIDENYRRNDLGHKTFTKVLEGLKSDGFEVVGERNRENRSPVLEKQIADNTVRISMFLLNPDSKDFLKKAAKGMETADIFIYDGHSGLGENLDLNRFKKELGKDLELPKNKKQIFYFNGCSTYAYYNTDFFDLKATTQDPEGRKNLNIVTTTLGAEFAVGAIHDLTFIRNIISPSRPSWQTIMNKIYAANPGLSPLTQVNGDEDNPHSPDL